MFGFWARKSYKDAIGQSTWLLLHAMADHYPLNEVERDAYETELTALVRALAVTYPCESCRAHIREYIDTTPPRFDNRAQTVRWMFNFHNSVNERLGKQRMLIEQYVHRLRDYEGVTVSGQCAQCTSL